MMILIWRGATLTIKQIGKNKNTALGFVLKCLALVIGTAIFSIVAIYVTNAIALEEFFSKRTTAFDSFEQRLDYATLTISAAIQVKCGKPPSKQIMGTPEVISAIQHIYNDEVLKSDIVNYAKRAAQKISCEI